MNTDNVFTNTYTTKTAGISGEKSLFLLRWLRGDIAFWKVVLLLQLLGGSLILLLFTFLNFVVVNPFNLILFFILMSVHVGFCTIVAWKVAGRVSQKRKSLMPALLIKGSAIIFCLYSMRVMYFTLTTF